MIRLYKVWQMIIVHRISVFSCLLKSFFFFFLLVRPYSCWVSSPGLLWGGVLGPIVVVLSVSVTSYIRIIV